MSINSQKEEYKKYMLKFLNCEEDENGNIIEKEFVSTNVTWIYGSTEEIRQNYINDLIDDLIDEDLLDCVSHVDKITRSGNIKGKFTQGETKILIIDNLTSENINEQYICNLIDGACFDLGHYSWNQIGIFPEIVYISSEKLPEQIYARSKFKDRVLRRITRVIKLD